jgi:hypothetical protein
LITAIHHCDASWVLKTARKQFILLRGAENLLFSRHSARTHRSLFLY